MTERRTSPLPGTPVLASAIDLMQTVLERVDTDALLPVRSGDLKISARITQDDQPAAGELRSIRPERVTHVLVEEQSGSAEQRDGTTVIFSGMLRKSLVAGRALRNFDGELSPYDAEINIGPGEGTPADYQQLKERIESLF